MIIFEEVVCGAELYCSIVTGVSKNRQLCVNERNALFR